MPELPEVETTKTSLSPLIGNQVTALQVYQPKLRWPMPKDLSHLTQYHLTDIHRRAKYLLLDFRLSNLDKQNDEGQNSRSLIIHLGMSGSLQQHAQGFTKRKHDHLIIDFIDTQGQITQLHYHDPRRFGAVLWTKDYQHKLLGHLGIEPLSNEFTAEYLYQYIHQRGKHTAKTPIKRAIKSVIMEQTVVVGVGNIYATESLFLANIHPATPANLLSLAQLTTLVTHIKAILTKAIAQGGSSLKDFTVANGVTGYFQQTLLAYGRENQPCFYCHTPLSNQKINGRASVYCTQCQPLPHSS